MNFAQPRAERAPLSHRALLIFLLGVWVTAAGVLETPQTRERFLSSGAEVVASTPQVLAAEIKAESTRLERVFKSAGIRAN